MRKLTTFTAIPTIILWIACYQSDAGFWYYFLAWFAGNGFGLLAYFVWVIVFPNKKKLDLKRTWGNEK